MTNTLIVAAKVFSNTLMFFAAKTEWLLQTLTFLQQKNVNMFVIF